MKLIHEYCPDPSENELDLDEQCHMAGFEVCCEQWICKGCGKIFKACDKRVWDDVVKIDD